MDQDRPSAEHALRQLAGSTAELYRAAAAGDLSAAQRILLQREADLENLRRPVEPAPLEAGQCDQLERLLSEGDAAMRALVACRETARSLLAELEAERRQLAGLAPQRSGPHARLDLNA